ncbi:hypothetical protein Pint_18148 [Pistacia integerrima]|uniref:Uncharacterized protein n=1 Tax=Pistacia integerrima TaxID=434235 RepID=A0ACC0Z0W9_9ROSI|nr:hypothetical protein Pint_18148 [Pistacia integerrima]
MGSEGKSKEKTKSRKRSSSSESEDERRSKRHRSDKKDKGKEKKHRKHRSDKEKKSRDKHRDKHQKGNHHSKHEIQQLTSEDYFSKNNEFATWLKEEKKLFFSDLSSESAREYFSDFVKVWNKNKLDSQYYEGISSAPRELELAMSYNKLSIFKLKSSPVYIGSRQIQTHLNPRTISTAPFKSCPIKQQEEQQESHSSHGFVSLSNHPNPEISCFYQKGFSQITKESTGKALHALCIQGMANLSVFHNNNLINMYSKFGYIDFARYVFDKMSERNDASWNNLISGVVRLRACRFVSDARRVFEEMPNRNVVSWTSLMAAYLECGTVMEVMSIYRHMKCEVGYQVLGDVIKFGLENTLYVPNSLISMFGNFGSVKEARNIFQSKNGTWGIHGLVVKLGLDSNVCVCNTLLSMYSEAGRSKDAEFVFQEMPERDLYSWNSLIACYVQDGKRLQALEVFSNMLQKQKIHNYVTFTSALAACSDPEFAVQGKIIHALMMPQRDTVSWNALIGGYAGNEEPNAAVEAYKLMKEEGTPMNCITIANVLGACLTPQDLLKHGMPIHGF